VFAILNRQIPILDSSEELALKPNDFTQKIYDQMVTERVLAVRNLDLSRIGKNNPLLSGLLKLACHVCESPWAAIIIIDENHLWLESSLPFPASETSKLNSICRIGVESEKIFEDENLSNNPQNTESHFFIETLNVHSYAGAPLFSENGVKIGFFCVFNSKPQKLSTSQYVNLEIIAQQAMAVIGSWNMENEINQAQLELEESQMYQKAVIENVPSMIYIKNAQKDMIYSLMNPACLRIFCVDESQVIGKKDSDFLPAQLASKLMANDLNALTSNKVVKIDKEELLTPWGLRFFTIYKVPIFDEKNVPKMLVVIMRDITVEVLANASLEQERMKSIHNSKLATIGEISAGVAHEINNPLAIIAGSINALNRCKEDPEKFNSRANSILRSVERIAKIVNNLKKFSRYNETSEFAYVPLSAIVKEALEMVETKANQLAVDIKFGNQFNGSIFCSDLEIEQVIINLVNNSIDAIRNLSEKWIEVSSWENNGKIVLRIQDSGNGISRDVEKKLFEPFFTTKPIGEGTGLGLSISKDILERHHATIKLNREISHTCFEVNFPLVGFATNAS
jgi:PAS domain S-box-containing protein